MKELMVFIKDTLSDYAKTEFQEVGRGSDGVVNLKETLIVYNIGGATYDGNMSRLGIPLSLDIWYRKKDLFVIESMVEDIDTRLSNSIVRLEDGKVLTMYRDPAFINNIPDVNKDILRKQVNFMIRYYN